MNKTFLEKLRFHAKNTPSKIAMSFYLFGDLQTITYDQLVADVQKSLQSSSLGQPGELIFVVSSLTYKSIVAYLACLFNQSVPAFLPPLTQRQDANLFEIEMQALMARFSPNMLITTDSERRIHDQKNLRLMRHGGFMQFSSGTTSLKKGVLITESRLIAQLELLGSSLSITEEDKIASWLPLYHDMGLITSLFLPLYFGCSVAYLDSVEWSFRPDSILNVIEKERSTLSWMPDFAFRHIVNHHKKTGGEIRNLSSIRYIINCSEPCRKATFVDFFNIFRAHSLKEECLQACYAMAETVFAVTQSQFMGGFEIIESIDGVISSGTSLSGFDIKIVSKAADEFGEVHIKSNLLFDGYFNQDIEVISRDGWYNTGDLGKIQNDNLFIVGRTDDILIVNGKKIIAHQIEDYIGLQTGFKPGRVFCTLNEDNLALIIYFEGEYERDIDKASIQRWVASSSGVSIDRLINLPYGTIIKSSSGKIARKKTLNKLSDFK